MSTTWCLSESHARDIMKGRILGSEEAKRWRHEFPLPFPHSLPVPYSAARLKEYRHTHILVRGLPAMPDGQPFTIVNLRRRFGICVAGSPCFSSIGLLSSQEVPWTTRAARSGWWLISRALAPGSKGMEFEECAASLMESGYEMPFAADVVYAAIFWELATGERLLRHDCTWCRDDVEGALLRVGYNQPRNGFHFMSYPRGTSREDHGALSIVLPDLSLHPP